MDIIDGHNLIPKLPGGSLQALDDEEQLIDLLQEYARVKRRQVGVFFDGAPPGQSGTRKYGVVTAHFVPSGQTADDAIRRYLDGLGPRARNVTVITSDRMVQSNARARHAQVKTSEAFAEELMRAREAGCPPGDPRPGRKPGSGAPAMPPGELEGWLDLFGIDKEEAEKPIEPERKRVTTKGKKKKRG